MSIKGQAWSHIPATTDDEDDGFVTEGGLHSTDHTWLEQTQPFVCSDVVFEMKLMKYWSIVRLLACCNIFYSSVYRAAIVWDFQPLV
jgi:hypothetical protein